MRRGEGHWKDEMKVLPPALTDLVNNVKSFFSPATLFSGPKHNEKKIVPTAEGKEEEMKGKLCKCFELLLLLLLILLSLVYVHAHSTLEHTMDECH